MNSVNGQLKRKSDAPKNPVLKRPSASHLRTDSNESSLVGEDASKVFRDDEDEHRPLYDNGNSRRTKVDALLMKAKNGLNNCLQTAALDNLKLDDIQKAVIYIDDHGLTVTPSETPCKFTLNGIEYPIGFLTHFIIIDQCCRINKTTEPMPDYMVKFLAGTDLTNL